MQNEFDVLTDEGTQIQISLIVLAFVLLDERPVGRDGTRSRLIVESKDDVAGVAPYAQFTIERKRSPDLTR